MTPRRLLAILALVVLVVAVAATALGFYTPPARAAMLVAIPTRPSLLRRSWRWVRCAWLRMQIGLTEDWLEDCRRDGLDDSLALRDFRAQLDELRCRLAVLEASA